MNSELVEHNIRLTQERDEFKRLLETSQARVKALEQENAILVSENKMLSLELAAAKWL